MALPDTVVLLTLGWRWLSTNAPCRVVYTVEERNRRGFAYGTLPGQPECGEEAFLVQRTPRQVGASMQPKPQRPAGARDIVQAVTNYPKEPQS